MLWVKADDGAPKARKIWVYLMEDEHRLVTLLDKHHVRRRNGSRFVREELLLGYWNRRPGTLVLSAEERGELGDRPKKRMGVSLTEGQWIRLGELADDLRISRGEMVRARISKMNCQRADLK